MPVGTAFAIGTNRFVSAAHVFDGFIGSNFALTGLRDSTGRVYEIDQILKYSMPQDFVVFSLKDAPNIKPLEAERRPAVGQAVYAVGNALGQGVVVRDGLYTSDTPEEWQGRWKWVRFSAAASPGSSCGPPLDAKGRVIGVVRGASPNENLNYAVPISLVLDGSETAAQFEAHGTFSLPMMTASTVTHLSQTGSLPRPHADFARLTLDTFNSHVDRSRKELLLSNHDEYFPKGKGATELLNRLYFTSLPRLIARDADGRWDAEEPSRTTSTDLSMNGLI